MYSMAVCAWEVGAVVFGVTAPHHTEHNDTTMATRSIHYAEFILAADACAINLPVSLCVCVCMCSVHPQFECVFRSYTFRVRATSSRELPAWLPALTTGAVAGDRR